MTQMTRTQIIADLLVHAGRADEDGWHKRALLMRAAAEMLEGDAAASNQQRVRSLEFDVMDAPMIRHSLTIGANTAMLCGQPLAKDRLREYTAILDKLIPPAAALFDEERWAELGMALASASAFEVTLDAPIWSRGGRNSWNQDGQITVRIGSKEWGSYKTDYKVGSPHIAAVHKLLSELAPMDCVGTYNDKECNNHGR